MKIRVVREQYRPGSTVGRLYLDGAFECFTLENGIRTKKVYGETAIPAGNYPVDVNYSPKFKRQLPILRNVPSFEGARIHSGNTSANTLGCILVGQSWKPGAETIAASRSALEALMSKIAQAVDRGEEVTVKVVQDNAPPDLALRDLQAPRGRTGRAGARKRRKPRKSVAKKPKNAGRAKTNRTKRMTRASKAKSGKHKSRRP
jgi:predicted RNA-binding protein with RPS1 domain